MARPPLAYRKALAYLSKAVSSAAPGTHGALPGVRVMCRKAGVSQETMLKALSTMRADGRVQTRSGRGAFVVCAGQAPALGDIGPPSHNPAACVQSEPPKQKWQLVADSLRREVLDGAVGSDADSALPPAKLLVERHGADHRTVRKALQALLREGHVALARGRYVVVRPAAARPGARVVLITRASAEFSFERMTARSVELLRHVEAQCIARGVRLDLVFGNFEGRDFVFRPTIAQAAGRDRSGLLGFLIWTIGFSTEQLNGILGQVEPVGLPVAIYDEVGVTLAQLGSRPKTTRVVTGTFSSACGLDVGRYLVRLGHRRVTYLDFEPLGDWSLARLQGLRQAFDESGVRNAVQCVTLGPATPPDFDTLVYNPERLAPSDLPPAAYDEAVRAIRRVESVVWDSIRETRRNPGLRRKLAEALRLPGVTAWAASGDSLAFQCLAFLKDKGVAVPDSLSVIGFDDLPEALFRGLTSYSFNPGGVARLLLDTVVRSPAALRRERAEGPQEVAGHVVERLTTAVAQG